MPLERTVVGLLNWSQMSVDYKLHQHRSHSQVVVGGRSRALSNQMMSTRRINDLVAIQLHICLVSHAARTDSSCSSLLVSRARLNGDDSLE